MISVRQVVDGMRLPATHFVGALAVGTRERLNRLDLQCVSSGVVSVLRDRDCGQLKERSYEHRRDTLHASTMPYPAFTSLLHLVEVARSVQPQDVTLRTSANRSYARWLRHEHQLAQALREHQRWPSDIATVLERTANAVEIHLSQRKYDPSVKDLPPSPLLLCWEDLDLLAEWRAEPVRDPLGWVPADALPSEFWQAAEEPTLRVIFVGRDRSLGVRRVAEGGQRYWPLMHAELEMAAQGTWTDLASQLVQRGGQVLMPQEDISHSQRRGLRSVIRRTMGKDPRRRSVIDMTVAVNLSHQADLVLIDRPAAWTALIANITAKTVILVLPEFQPPENLVKFAPGGVLPLVSPDDAEHSSLPISVRYDEEDPNDWLGQALLAWHAQQAVIHRWQVGRVVEVHRVAGVTHTSGFPARLDWPALRLLPGQGQGQVVAATDELLLRAAAWYQLASRREVALPKQLLTQVAWVADAVRGISADDAPQHLAQHFQGRSPREKMMARVWLDVLYSPVDGPASLQFVRADHEVMTYIGR